jgi:hypothetical protein
MNMETANWNEHGDIRYGDHPPIALNNPPPPPPPPPQIGMNMETYDIAINMRTARQAMMQHI